VTDSNASAAVQAYTYSIRNLVKASNHIVEMDATLNIWHWISGLGSLTQQLCKLLARWSQVAANESAKKPPAPELEGGAKLTQYNDKLAAINQRVSRISGLMGPINNLLDWANIIKSGDIDQQNEGTLLLFQKWGALRIFYEEALKARDLAAHPENFGPRDSKAKES
jgi:hypothetical protein